MNDDNSKTDQVEVSTENLKNSEANSFESVGNHEDFTIENIKNTMSKKNERMVETHVEMSGITDVLEIEGQISKDDKVVEELNKTQQKYIVKRVNLCQEKLQNWVGTE